MDPANRGKSWAANQQGTIIQRHSSETDLDWELRVFAHTEDDKDPQHAAFFAEQLAERRRCAKIQEGLSVSRRGRTKSSSVNDGISGSALPSTHASPNTMERSSFASEAAQNKMGGGKDTLDERITRRQSMSLDRSGTSKEAMSVSAEGSSLLALASHSDLSESSESILAGENDFLQWAENTMGIIATASQVAEALNKRVDEIENDTASAAQENARLSRLEETLTQQYSVLADKLVSEMKMASNYRAVVFATQRQALDRFEEYVVMEAKLKFLGGHLAQHLITRDMQPLAELLEGMTKKLADMRDSNERSINQVSRIRSSLYNHVVPVIASVDEMDDVEVVASDDRKQKGKQRAV